MINQSGVLNRLTGLLMKRQFNIESITVGHTEQPNFSKMTFVVNVEDERKIEQLVKQLSKQIDVLKVNDITDKSIVLRELALVKVISPPNLRLEMNSIVEPFRAQIIDTAKNVVTYQVVGHPEKLMPLSNSFDHMALKNLHVQEQLPPFVKHKNLKPATLYFKIVCI